MLRLSQVDRNWTLLLTALLASAACIESRSYLGGDTGQGGTSAGSAGEESPAGATGGEGGNGATPAGSGATPGTGVETLRRSTIAAGDYFNCGILTNGGIHCWGADDEGQLSQAPTGGDFISIAAGRRHACALHRDNTLECWGNNEQQQAPRKPKPELYGYFQWIACGDDFTCGVRLDGSPLCFGSSQAGKLAVPPDQYRMIATGANTACGVRTDGSLACWGDDTSSVVHHVPSGSFTTVSVGREHACAIDDERKMTCWGNGEGGDGTGITRTDVRPGEYLRVSAGYFHTAAITQGEHFTCFGSPPDSQQCTTVAYVVGVWHDVAAGPYHTCILGRPEASATDGTVECFGWDSGAVSPAAKLFKLP